MHILIDETGTFTEIGQPLSISMIGTLNREGTKAKHKRKKEPAKT
jgi:hypothetical protein